jgi:hypothetical protein
MRIKDEGKRLARAQGYAARLQQRRERLQERELANMPPPPPPPPPAQTGVMRRSHAKIAWRASLAATADLMPGKYALTAESTTLAPTTFARTVMDRRARTVNIQYDPSTDKVGDDRDTQVGRLAATFTHELALHAKNAPNSGTTEEAEHRSMFEKAGRKQYLQASRRTFNELHNNEQKRAFVSEWYRDVKGHSHGAEVEKIELRPEQVPERRKFSDSRQWAKTRRNSMLDAIENPGNHPWVKK